MTTPLDGVLAWLRPQLRCHTVADGADQHRAVGAWRHVFHSHNGLCMIILTFVSPREVIISKRAPIEVFGNHLERQSLA